MQWQRPRSHSVPNMALKDEEDIEDHNEYGFRIERDFQYEI